MGHAGVTAHFFQKCNAFFFNGVQDPHLVGTGLASPSNKGEVYGLIASLSCPLPTWRGCQCLMRQLGQEFLPVCHSFAPLANQARNFPNNPVFPSPFREEAFLGSKPVSRLFFSILCCLPSTNSMSFPLGQLDLLHRHPGESRGPENLKSPDSVVRRNDIGGPRRCRGA
jgi:hypothetical protein